ncbi:MAG: hypothetical protein ACFE7R_08265 [Candidatus Hodarchaeota archaeon]
MTTISTARVNCSGCGETVNVVYHPSICTWLNPSSVQDIYNHGSDVKCPNCDYRIPRRGRILINSPGGMIYLDLDAELDEVRGVLESIGLVNAAGDILSATEQRAMFRKIYPDPDELQ